jgi:hypothetical protein
MSTVKSQNKTCFVISPIGDEGSPERKHADRVFRWIIKPAMDRFGINPIRADLDTKPGLISEDMWKHIREDDLCVAVITYHNPNVFYELAIAQALGRPVIVLAEEGTEIPFDIRDVRVVRYDMELEPLVDGVHANKVAEHVKALEATGYPLRSPFRDLSVGAEDGDVKFFPEADSFGGYDEWRQLLADTEEAFDIMGVALNSWRKTEGFTDLVAEKASSGCSVRILVMHQDNPALPELNRRTLHKADYGELVATIDAMHAWFSKIADESPNVELRQMRRGILHYQLTRTDQYAVAVQYFYALQPGISPAWQCARGSNLYDWAKREFDMLWDVNAPPTVVASEAGA